MKFLKLQLDDQELYNIENMEEKLAYLYTNLPAFRRLYSDQGDVFWLRHLITFREFFYILIRAKFEQKEGQCLHWLINPLEKTFIRIHKLLFAGDFDSAKQSLKLIKKHVFKLDAICPLITNSQCRLIASSSVKSAYKSLFGSHLGHDKIAIIKAFLASGLYKHFCGSLGVLLKRCNVTIDMPSSFDDNSPNMQYWMPFPFWAKCEYEAGVFENYLVHYYGNRLSEMLLSSCVNKAFCSKAFPKCCRTFLKDYSTRLVEEPEKYQRKEYMRCEKHALCYVRLVHSESCKNPHVSCVRKSRCVIRCDHDCVKKNPESKSYKDRWKPSMVTIHQSSKENCRDVSTLAETEKSYRAVETYLTQTVDYDYDWTDEQLPFWKSLPPDLMNFAKQIKRKEKTKSRLRDKLSKKAKKEAKKDESLHVFPIDQLDNWNALEFRLRLYVKAQKQFKEELGDDLLCRLLRGKVGNTDNPLQDLFEEKLELEYLFPNEVANSSAIKKFQSVGVGCDIPLDMEFLSDLKRLHIKKRLMEKYNIESLKFLEGMSARKSSEGMSSENSLEEMSAKEKMSCCIDYLTQKHNVTEGQMTSSTYIDENFTRIDYFPKTAETLLKMKSEVKKNKKNGKKSQKGSNNKISNMRETSSLKPGEAVSDCEYNGMCNDFQLLDITATDKQKFKEIIQITAKNDKINTNPSVPIKESEPGDETVKMEVNNSHQDLTNLLDGIEQPLTLENIVTNPKLVEDIIKHMETDILEVEIGEEKMLKTETKKNDSGNKVKLTKLRICGYCKKREPTRRTFKKCKLCKDKGSIEPRYYCSKSCQITDWKGRHEEYHLSMPQD